MFSAVGSAQSLVMLVLGVLAFVAQVVAIVDAARHRADAFVAAS
jgi:molybdopterin synthase catalytic subunit